MVSSLCIEVSLAIYTIHRRSQYVLAAHASSRLKDFGEELRKVIKSIMPSQTLIHIVLDGLSEERDEDMSNSAHASYRMGSGQADVSLVRLTVFGIEVLTLFLSLF